MESTLNQRLWMQRLRSAHGINALAAHECNALTARMKSTLNQRLWMQRLRSAHGINDLPAVMLAALKQRSWNSSAWNQHSRMADKRTIVASKTSRYEIEVKTKTNKRCMGDVDEETLVDYDSQTCSRLPQIERRTTASLSLLPQGDS
eukprot:TRINITY_DN23865_c0_g4_i1.p1 TRINITY_DN23865_c0_g4~~TRINITY_DN23865_c0_g4_i1.p1  ORF type:complete len:147 (+),score=8.65 TRINITY_DN23865_c0_g4_i1:405-845(+)